jgi:LEA14-like dessication related protein
MNKKLLFGIITSAVTTLSFIEYRRYLQMMDNVSIMPDNFKFENQGTNFIINFSLQITNNTNKSLDVIRVNGDLYIGNIYLGSFNTLQRTTIRANSTSTLPISAIIDARRILNNIEGKNLNSKTIIVKTNSVIKFNLLGLLGIPVKVKNETNIETGNLIRDVKSLIDGFKSLFRRAA